MQNFTSKQSADGFQLTVEDEVPCIFIYLFSLSNFQQRLLLHRIGTGMEFTFPVRSSTGLEREMAVDIRLAVTVCG